MSAFLWTMLVMHALSVCIQARILANAANGHPIPERTPGVLALALVINALLSVWMVVLIVKGAA